MSPSPTITTVPVSAIIPGANDRKIFDADKLQELAASIAVSGLLEHPVVRPIGHDRYELIAGERRWRAVQLLGWTEIPVTVREMSDHEAAEAMLAENFHRVNLDPIEEAGAYRKWSDTFGWSTAEIASRANTTPYRVESRLRLLALIDEWQYLVSHGDVKISYLTGLGSLDPNRQRQALRHFLDDPTITKDAFSAIVSKLWEYQSAESLFELANEEWSAADHAPKVKAPSRTALVALLARLTEAVDDDALAAEARAVLAAEQSAVAAKQSAAGLKAAASRKARIAA